MGIAAIQAGAAQYLTDGATPDNLNWKDYTKTPVVVTDEDGEHSITFKSGEKNLCWAASASNMLDWWQESNKNLAVKQPLPEEEAIWHTFSDSFNDEGFEQHAGVSWWLSGEYGMTFNPECDEQARLKEGCTHGNYYQFSQAEGASYLTGYFISPHIDYIKSPLVNAFKAGHCVGLGITDVTGMSGHAITAWGVEQDDATGKITAIWITDSDDDTKKLVETEGTVAVESTPNGLRKCAVEEREIPTANGYSVTALVLTDYEAIYLSNRPNGDQAERKIIYIDEITILSKNPHAPVDTSMVSRLSTTNGKRCYTLLNQAFNLEQAASYNKMPTANDNSGLSANNEEPATDVENMKDHALFLLKGYDLPGMERFAAAMAGSSIPTLGKAFSDDMNRQLRTMRSRANQSTRSFAPGKNYYMWVEADGSTSRLSSESAGTDAGYDLQSWGGTVGITSKFAEEVHAGIALTALQGNFSAHSYGRAKGDLDTYYFTTFATVNSGNWEHSFVATAAKADTTLSREVSYSHEKTGTFYSRNRGKSEGKGFGFMYETAYNIKCKESSLTFSPVLNVSATHSRLHGYTERGDALALAPGTTDMTLFTLGAGARLQGEFGENWFNRKAQFQCRAMVNTYMGDRRAETPMQFAANPARQTIRSAESGAIGLELGAGAALPLGNGSSAIYADAAAEFNSGYNSANFNLGYRFSF